MKKVSIVIGCFNDEQYIGRAIESALNQDYSLVEVIVIDDGSKDRSKKIIENYGEKIKFIFKENGGQRSVYNLGYECVESDYLIFLDSDDFLEKMAVTRCMDAINGRSDVSKVQYKLRLADENGNYLNGSTPGLLDGRNAGDLLINHGILYYSSPGSGNLYSKKLLKGFFPLPISSKDKHGADFFLIVAAAVSGVILSIQDSLGGYTLRNFAKNRESPIFGNSAVTYGGTIDSSREIEGINWMPMVVPELASKIKRIKNTSMEKVIYGGLALSEQVSFYQLALAQLRFSKYAIIDPWRGMGGKMALIVWSFVVLMMPRIFRRKLVRLFCNQAARV